MEKNFKKRGIASFNGLNIGKNNQITFKLKLSYEEVVTGISLLQATNTDVTVHAKVGTGKVMDLGIFTISNVTFDRDRNSCVTLKSLLDNINLDNITETITDDIVQFRFMAVLELPDLEKEEGEE